MSHHQHIPHRCIAWPHERAEAVRTAARHLGISGEKFIQLAIAEKLYRTVGEMTLSNVRP